MFPPAQYLGTAKKVLLNWHNWEYKAPYWSVIITKILQFVTVFKKKMYIILHFLFLTQIQFCSNPQWAYTAQQQGRKTALLPLSFMFQFFVCACLCVGGNGRSYFKLGNTQENWSFLFTSFEREHPDSS